MDKQQNNRTLSAHNLTRYDESLSAEEKLHLGHVTPVTFDAES
jgi:hypothetical protein